MVITVLSGAKERTAKERPGWNFQSFKNMPCWKFDHKNGFINLEIRHRSRTKHYFHACRFECR